MAGGGGQLDRGWDLLERGEYEAALEIAEALLQERPDDPDAMFLAGSSLFELGEVGEAEEKLGRTLELDPSKVQARLTRAALLYEACRFDEALQEVGRALPHEPGSPYAHYLKGLLLDMKGRSAEADACIARAAELDPERYRVPESIGRAEFDAAVSDALSRLPAEFRDRIGNLPVLVEEIPSAALLDTLEDPAPDLLGLFVGTPLPQKSHMDVPGLPEAVYLFKRNLERACESREELVEEIRVTLLHEIGHYLGLDEDDLEEAGYA